MAVGQIVHGCHRDVEPSPRVIDSKDMDRLAPVRERVALAALATPGVSAGAQVQLVYEYNKVCREERRQCSKDTHVWRVPASNSTASANVRETSVVALHVPAVTGYETVGAVRAGHDGHGAHGIIIAGVI